MEIVANKKYTTRSGSEVTLEKVDNQTDYLINRGWVFIGYITNDKFNRKEAYYKADGTCPHLDYLDIIKEDSNISYTETKELFKIGTYGYLKVLSDDGEFVTYEFEIPDDDAIFRRQIIRDTANALNALVDFLEKRNGPEK